MKTLNLHNKFEYRTRINDLRILIGKGNHVLKFNNLASQLISMKSKLKNISFCLIILISLGTSCYTFNQDKNDSADNSKISHDTTGKKIASAKSIPPDYQELKNKIALQFKNAKPVQFGEFIKGVKVKINTKEKLIALTFDACGGGGGSGYNADLINYLRKEKIPATLFITGIWIDSNKKTFAQLASDTLFEIENHGLKHRLCSVNGASVYGIKGTKNPEEVVDEMELNARKIEQLTGIRPKFFRSATAYTDDVCVQIAAQLNMQIVSYSVLSGDAVPNTPANIISENIMKQIKPGSIVIMHFNHPAWNEKDALQQVIPKLKVMGYSFVRLEKFPLKGNFSDDNIKSPPKP
jgi:peptidoglycan/xylan/chitin deacetylase (PgdA/CDA1 family)